MRTRVRGKGQITIPAQIRSAARLSEGDPVEVELTPDGILLRPQKLIDSTQAWFWTPAWQAGERAAEGDREAGRSDRFNTDEEFLAALESCTKPPDANLRAP